MQHIKYIQNRLINLSGTMSYLTIDPSVSECHASLFITMVPEKFDENSFDYLVAGLKALPGGFTIFPLGILSRPLHPDFFPSLISKRSQKPGLWAGGARFDGHSLSITYLEREEWAGSSLKRMRNVNKIGEALFELYGSHDRMVDYGGHKMLAWG